MINERDKDTLAAILDYCDRINNIVERFGKAKGTFVSEDRGDHSSVSYPSSRVNSGSEIILPSLSMSEIISPLFSTTRNNPPFVSPITL